MLSFKHPFCLGLIVGSLTLGLLPLGFQICPGDEPSFALPPVLNLSELTTPLDQPTQFFDWAAEPIYRKDIRIASSASCAASACHGGARPSVADEFVSRGAEYPNWLAKDPHANSWRTMCSDESLAILENLGIMRGAEIVDTAGYDNCLACHNTTLKTSEPRSTEFHAEGVGCAACHGPSELWNGEHYRSGVKPAAAASDGWVDNEDLLIRARVCAACHIGDRDRDMNHDIIAAGHPSLHYEFASYHAKLPKHWRDSREHGQDFEAKLWFAGQIAGLDAGLSLMESRAERRLPVSQWPEFANANCSTCHQNLRIPSTDSHRNRDVAGAAFPAGPFFGVIQWFRSSDESEVKSDSGRRILKALSELEAELTKSTIPDPVRTAAAARLARLELSHWLTGPDGEAAMARFSTFEAHRLSVALSTNPVVSESWEHAVQFYLATLSARPGKPNAWDDETLRRARALREALLLDSDSSLISIADVPDRGIPGKVFKLGAALRTQVSNDSRKADGLDANAGLRISDAVDVVPKQSKSKMSQPPVEPR